MTGYLKEHIGLIRFTVRWLLLGSLVGVLAGAACALFTHGLEIVTLFRNYNPWVLYWLPLAGVFSAYLYQTFGKEAEGGNNLIIDEVLEFRGRLRFVMAPLILVATWLTHLFGGSAGREGTGVQLGGSIAAKASELLKLNKSDAQMMLMAGISAGFGAIFGTPVAGAIFGMEVISRGEIRFASAIACVAASTVGDEVVRLLSAHHEQFVVPTMHIDYYVLLRVLGASIFFAIASRLFSDLTHGIAVKTSKYIKSPIVRPAIGGVLVIILYLIVQDDSYLGLSIPLMNKALSGGEVAPYSFALKLLFTAVTLGFGFKGGEVTPLFIIGALLGNTLAPLFGFDPRFLSAIGFITVFAAASKTPIASTITGIELFGANYASPLILSTFVAYVIVGNSGIYSTQRQAVTFGVDIEEHNAEATTAIPPIEINEATASIGAATTVQEDGVQK